MSTSTMTARRLSVLINKHLRYVDAVPLYLICLSRLAGKFRRFEKQADHVRRPQMPIPNHKG